MARDQSPHERIDLVLPASGYNLHWQWGVLRRLMEAETFWKRVDRLFGISGGSIAIIYSYRMPGHESSCYSDVVAWYEKNGGRPFTWQFALEQGFKTYCVSNNEFTPKEVNFGVTKWSPINPIPRFQWVQADPQKDEAFEVSLGSLSIPFVTMFPSRENLKHGFDGGLTLRRPKLPGPRTNKVISISTTRTSTDNSQCIVQKRSHIPIFGRSSRVAFQEAYLCGRENAEEFLKKYFA